MVIAGILLILIKYRIIKIKFLKPMRESYKIIPSLEERNAIKVKPESGED